MNSLLIWGTPNNHWTPLEFIDYLGIPHLPPEQCWISRHHLLAARGPDSRIQAAESRLHPISNTSAKRNLEQLRGFRGAHLDSGVSLESLEQTKPSADLLFQFDHQTPWHVSGILQTAKSWEFLWNSLIIHGTPNTNESVWNPLDSVRNPMDSVRKSIHISGCPK